MNIYRSKKVPSIASFIPLCSFEAGHCWQLGGGWLSSWGCFCSGSRGGGRIRSSLYITKHFPHSQGIVFEHREGSWGDNVNTTQVY